MTIFRYIIKRFVTPMVGVVLAFALAGTAAVTFAQTGGPQITNVTVNSVTDTGAAITFTTSAPAGAKIYYGRTTAYGSISPTLGYTTPDTTNHLITLGSLTPSTTYHYQIEAKDATGISKSADRSFTTKASVSGGGGPLVLTNIVADCVDTRCQILFTPSKAANVQLVWDATQHAGFAAYPAGNVVADPAGTYSASRRALAIPASGTFAPGTIYYYRLKANDNPDPTKANTLETNDLQFRTSTTSNDHTFSTGGCTLADGSTIPIGSCGAGGFYCPSGGGVAVQDCTQSCGFTCATSSTCRTNGNCEADPPLSGSPFQCNNTTPGPADCFDDNGVIRNPAPAGCYTTWGKCNANTILKVQKDRGCNLWLTCATSVQTEAKPTAPAENLCLTLAACNSLSAEGQCNSYLPQGQCDNDTLSFCATDNDCAAGGTCNLPNANQPTQALKDLTYATPSAVKEIANLSGNVIAGLDWNQIGGATVIQGNLPWQLMRQAGGDSQITNGDFESNPPNVDPWAYVPTTAPTGNLSVEFEDQSNSINHVAHVSFVTQQPKTSGTCSNATATTCTADANCPAGGICRIGVCSNDGTKACSLDSTCTAPGTCDRNAVVPFSGIASQEFNAEPSEFYYAEVRVRAVAGTPTIRVQFGYAGYTRFSVGTTPTYVDVVAKSAWQRVTLGPIEGMSGSTQFAVVCADNATCDGAEIFVDDIQVKPVLQVNTNPSYITPSCRLYPKDDSPACDYVDQSGILFKGWKGYCLETDSVTGTCLSWWPVDILRGESSLFSSNVQVGYDDRTPLYLCAEAAGNNKGGPFSSDPYVLSSKHQSDYAGSPCNPVGNNCGLFGTGTKEVFAADSTIAMCDNNFTNACTTTLAPPDTDYHIREDEITKMAWNASFTTGHEPASIVFNNNDAFHSSSAGNPYFPTAQDLASDPQANCTDVDNGNCRVAYSIYRSEDASFIYWNYQNTVCQQNAQLNQNCITAKAVFDKTTRELIRYELSEDDQTGNNTEGVAYKILVYAKEACNQLVEVVQPDGTNQAFASRVKSTAYTVPDVGIKQFTDLAPFGGAYGPLAGGLSPANWQLLTIEQQNTTKIDLPGQSRGGQPYACNGPCTPFVCDLNPALSCLNADGTVNTTAVRQCENLDVDGDGEGDGVCTGGKLTVGSAIGPQSFDTTHSPTAVSPTTDKAFFAQERIRRVFTQGYSLWSWSNGAYHESLTSAGAPFIPWLSPGTVCPVDSTGVPKRPAYPNDYCAVPPAFVAGSAQFLSGGGSSATISGGSGSIGLKFNTTADPDQIPLQGFTIDWGDSSNTYSYPYAPKNDPANPHIFSHVYNNTGPTCSGSVTSNCCTIQNGRKSCTYGIRIQVKDNWGWCNNAVAGNKCPTTLSSANDTGLTVHVQP